MEAYSNAHHPHTRTSHLTQLYSDAKKSALISLEAPPTQTQQFSALHLKYRIQKDRLITWGLAWSDDEKGPDGSIDESVARAGLTETVDSVLRNIKEVTEEAERIKIASSRGILTKGGDSKLPQSDTFDEARYEDLLRDLTTSIDTLYDLSRSRKALARGEHPTFNTAPAVPLVLDEKPASAAATSRKTSPSRKGFFSLQTDTASELTLVNPPPFVRPELSPYFGLPPRIELSAIRLPEEGPPPYEALGVPSTTRLVGTLIRAKASSTVQNAVGSSASEVPILVEYANFDSTYRETGVPPPLQRLESLSSFFQPMRPESQTNLSLLGYFEDTQEPRIGLVYDLPYSIQNRIQGTVENDAQQFSPISLLKLVQKANKAQTSNTEAATPALEDRFRIALSLTQQLYALHSRDVAHGNVNSSSVIFATTENESPQTRQKQLRAPLWASFDLFSKCSVEGVRRAIDLNIYRHPTDNPQSSDRDTSSDVKYDLYGLAILLLEIGLWTPIGDLYKAKYTLSDFKLRLEKLWAPKLAAKCGSAYMCAVQVCLRAADESVANTDATYDFVLRSLQRCCALDADVAADPLLANTPMADATSTAYNEKVKRKPLPDRAPNSRQMSADSPDLFRTHSFSSTVASSPQSRLTTVPNLPATSGMVPDLPSRSRRQVAPNSTLPRGLVSRENTLPETKSSVSGGRFTSIPSFKEYKQKIVLIQRKWREHRERRRLTRGIPLGDENVAADATVAPRARSKRTEFPALQLPKAVVDDWHNSTSLRLAKLVEKALKGSPESSSIALTAFGETEDTARPTYLVCCSSTARVKQVLKRHFLFDSETCDVRVRKDEIRRCRRSRRVGASAEARRSMALSDGDVYGNAANPDYQERPLCGASIGAFRDDEHLPPVSFGGVVLIDGRAYGMSVHHMLEADDDEEYEASDPDPDDESDTSSIRSFDNLSIHSESDDESTVRQPSTVDEIGAGTDAHDGDCPGIFPGDFEEVAITQPALDDAIDLDLHVDEEEDDDEDSGIDEDHLLSYKLGQVHASSGLKRSPTSLEGGFKSISQSLPQEIDWALFELLPPRVHPYNIVRGGRKYCSAGAGTSASPSPSSSMSRQSHSASSRDSYPAAIRTSTDLACTKVHCLGRTSGLAAGTISSTMELVKIHGRSTFSASWTVEGNFGVGGDSGAWVISNDDGTVCGHVLASRRGRTYICPMDLLLEDIRTTLGAAKVSLPVRPSRAARAAVAKEAKEAREARDARHANAAANAAGQPGEQQRRRVGVMEIESSSGGSSGGGVPLPIHHHHERGSSGATHDRFDRAAEQVRAAG